MYFSLPDADRAVPWEGGGRQDLEGDLAPRARLRGVDRVAEVVPVSSFWVSILLTIWPEIVSNGDGEMT